MSSLQNKLLVAGAVVVAGALFFVVRSSSPGAGSGNGVANGAASTAGPSDSAAPAGPRPLLVSSTKGDPAHLHLFSFTPPSELSPLAKGTNTEYDGVYSPDGRRIAFAALTNEPGSPPAGQIFTMARDGSDRKAITQAEPGRVASSPKWSPDGKSIAYSSVKFQDGQQPNITVQLMQADGSGARQVVEGVLPDWSPDGKSIAFTAFDFNQTFAPSLRVVDVAGGASKELTHGENAMMPAYSPDGATIAFVSDGGAGALPDIYLMNADGSNKRRLTKTDADFETGPAWSADGQTVYFARLSNEEVPHATLQSMPVAGGEPKRLSEEGMTTIPGNGAGFLMVMLTGQGRTLFELPKDAPPGGAAPSATR
ncbi:MAG: DPP IV N-terminal domain-containing protein [Polyangiaceae bacterium]